MTKLDRYQWLLSNGSESVRFIAGVFLDGKNATLRIKGLMVAVQSGLEVSDCSFTMPYEKISVGGHSIGPEFLEALAKSS